MKYRLHYIATLLGTLSAALSSASANVTVDQKEYDLALVQDQHDFSLSELKEALMTTMKEHSGIGFLAFDNVSFSVDDVTIAQNYDDEYGGPAGVAFTGDVYLNFNKTLTFADDKVGFMLGFDVASTGHTKSHLTIDLQRGFLDGMEWNKDTVSDMYFYTFFQCQYFSNSGSPLDFDVRLNGQEAGVFIDGYKYVGYVKDPGDVQNGEIAVIPLSTTSTGYDGLMPGWNGQALSLVAKPQVGWDAPSVPEPTTGTLSLLALAGLCARRRRK